MSFSFEFVDDGIKCCVCGSTDVVTSSYTDAEQDTKEVYSKETDDVTEQTVTVSGETILTCKCSSCGNTDSDAL